MIDIKDMWNNIHTIKIINEQQYGRTVVHK